MDTLIRHLETMDELRRTGDPQPWTILFLVARCYARSLEYEMQKAGAC